MTLRSLAVLAALVATTQTLAAAPASAPSRQGYRLTGPTRLVHPGAVFTVEMKPEQAEIPCTLTIKQGATILASRPMPKATISRRERTPIARATIELDASAWVDGTYVAELDWAPPASAPATHPATSAPPLATMKLEVIRAWFQKTWQGDKRQELAVWIEHANQFGGKKFQPLHDNLKRMFDSPSEDLAGLRGILIRSYDNPQLERRMPYTMYVPKAYDPKSPMPLMLLLHGSGYNYLNIFGDMLNGQEFETNPMLIANAGAFLYQEFRHMALNDVLWVLEDVSRKYNVDSDRVYIQGISLGGRGAMEIAALRPDLFAAICPQGTYGMMQEPDDIPDFLWQDEWARWSIARWDFRSYLPNLRNIPMQIIYGQRDKTTPPFHALTYAHLMNKRYGGHAEALGFDADHHISMPKYNWSDTRAWLLKYKRQQWPRVVTARTANLRFNRFYWVTIGAMRTQWQMADVSAEIKDDLLQVRTRNVARLKLEPPYGFTYAVVDGQTLQVSATQPSTGPIATTRPLCEIHLASSAPGQWRIVEKTEWESAPPMSKRHGLSGPIWDVMHGKCLSVYGAAGTTEETARLRQIAQSIARLDVAWGTETLPVLAHNELTDSQKSDCNLLLVGDARTNPLLAGHRWPFDLERIGKGEGISIFDQTLNGPDDAVMFIYPSPFAPGRYVYIVAPAQPAKISPGYRRDRREAAIIGPNSMWTTAIWADWLVRGRTPAAEAKDSRPISIDGVFDENWKLQKMPGAMINGTPMNWE